MKPMWLVALLVMLKEAWSARRDAHIRFLELQVEMLQSRLPGNRVILGPAERQRLMKLGAEVDHEVKDTLSIVCIKTYRRWVREDGDGRQPGKVGRPRLTASLREVILRLARENIGWGVRRILGEMKKLALKVSRTSVRRVLTDENILPDPDRHAPKGVETPWRKFLALHMNVMVACDFFCKTIWTPLGRQMAYALTFIHLGSRKVFVSPSTLNPTDEWVQQQGRNVGMWAAEEGIDIRFLIHDHDTKFTDAFDSLFDRPNGGVVKTPIAAPIANCYAESWIGSLKRECLNHFFCFSLGLLDYIAQTYVDYHNKFRPHQGLGNRPPGANDGQGPAAVEIDPKSIRCQSWLGGLLKHYQRKAA